MWNLFLGFFFSLVGGALFIWAKKADEPMLLGCSLVIMFFSYCTPNVWWTAGIGTVLCGLIPYLKE